jgi:hypothetical protein
MMHETDQAAIAVLQSQLERLRAEVGELSKSTKALVDAWNTATGMVKFVKLLSTVVAAIGAIYLFVKHGFTRPV